MDAAAHSQPSGAMGTRLALQMEQDTVTARFVLVVVWAHEIDMMAGDLQGISDWHHPTIFLHHPG